MGFGKMITLDQWVGMSMGLAIKAIPYFLVLVGIVSLYEAYLRKCVKKNKRYTFLTVWGIAKHILRYHLDLWKIPVRKQGKRWVCRICQGRSKNSHRVFL